MGNSKTKQNIWQVYLLKCADTTLYCGITSDLDARIRDHNNGTGAKYTRGRGPTSLVAVTPLMSKSDALRLERLVKRQPAANKVHTLNQGVIKQ